MHIRYRKTLISGFGLLGILLICFWLLAAIVGGLLLPFAPDAYVAGPFQAPSIQHWLGTNDVGQDVGSQIVAGARTSLGIAFGAAVLSTISGLLFGALPAFFGGWLDRIIARLIDVGLVVPPVLAAMLAASYIQPGALVLICLLAFFFWPGTGRILRAQTLSLKESAHVQAAQAFGASRLYLFRRHILPDLRPLMTATLIHDARRAVFLEAGLAFLGISDPTAQSWGRMIQQALAFTYLDVWRWWLVSPGLAVSTTILAFSLCGSAIESAMHPNRLALPEEHEVGESVTNGRT